MDSLIAQESNSRNTFLKFFSCYNFSRVKKRNITHNVSINVKIHHEFSSTSKFRFHCNLSIVRAFKIKAIVRNIEILHKQNSSFLSFFFQKKSYLELSYSDANAEKITVI